MGIMSWLLVTKSGCLFYRNLDGSGLDVEKREIYACAVNQTLIS